MEALTQQLSDLRLRRIDVPDWNAPVATAHRIQSLPTLWLYDGTSLVSRDTREVLQWLAKRRTS
ncbi:MAG: hypothetical protein AB7I19_20000 [Planctomycetota bacterium]